ncbi:MAG TPA: 2OG-Fe(II) oxygenase [Rhodopila sp.]|nr:2OG-Fe(II) oxygenase [Rhodopila sp.]
MPENVSTVLSIGLRVPPIFGIDANGRFYAGEQQYGRPAILLLAGGGAVGRMPDLLSAIAPLAADFADRNADMLLIMEDNPGAIPAPPPPMRAIDCGDFLRRCGLGPEDIRVVVHDRNLRIALVVHPDHEADLAASCLDALDRLPHEPPADISMPAPAIVLPNLLPPSLCRDLIRLFDTGPVVDGGVARVDAAGVIANVVDHAKKHRRDLVIPPGSELYATLQAMLLERCRPEIAKAFRVQVAYTDRMLVACYDDSGGWFRRHRDTDAANVAFREFALSLNLNTGEYDGGHLLFPEYNDHRYSPPAGAGVIFAASVLHEVAEVTAGRRYVLLTFLHGEAAEQRRLAWEARSHAELGAAAPGSPASQPSQPASKPAAATAGI